MFAFAKKNFTASHNNYTGEPTRCVIRTKELKNSLQAKRRKRRAEKFFASKATKGRAEKLKFLAEPSGEAKRNFEKLKN